ncbi:MAG: AzlD domain-containing protein [Proteobacteria bacterium]|nr:AzlD domain-containing protein [Pseudomonadota bacterium]
MSFETAFLPLLLAMTVISFICRAGGFWLMRYVPTTPAVEAALKATPLAVMVGIVTPVAARGNPPELAALAVIVIIVRLTGSDILAAILGVATVAGLRILLGSP